MARKRILDEDMANNRSKLIPIAICVDRSWSMGEGTKKTDLEAGLKKFYSDIEADPRTRYGADLCLIGFSGSASVMQPFTDINSIDRDVQLELETTGTNISGAVSLALDLLAKRREYYKQAAGGRRAARPTLVLMTDGGSNVGVEDEPLVINQVRELADQKRLTVITIAIGDDGELDWETLVDFSPEVPPLQLESLSSFKEFFKVLSDSMSRSASEGSEAGPEIEPDDIEDLVPVGTLKQTVPPSKLDKYKNYKEMFQG
ncbi:MAG: vWA domain-containing protein [Canibacter sp.]